MEPEFSLQCSQDQATGQYLGPDESSPHLPHHIFQRSLPKLSSHLRLYISHLSIHATSSLILSP
jgi:hypothetical protein